MRHRQSALVRPSGVVAPDFGVEMRCLRANAVASPRFSPKATSTHCGFAAEAVSGRT